MARRRTRCPCHSGRDHDRCCRPLHRGQPAPSPERLFRSRYCAYALGNADYVISTTDPEGPAFEPDEARWRESIATFKARTSFRGFEVLARRTEGDRGWVSYRLNLTQNGEAVSYVEHSTFRRADDGRWRYHGPDDDAE